MKCVFALLIALALLVVACTGNEEPSISMEDWRTIEPKQAPWTLKVPLGWNASTVEFDPEPMGRVGRIVTTAVATTGFYPGASAPRPNTTGGASELLGQDGAVVLVQAMSVPREDDIWDPPAGADLSSKPPSQWHSDAQNPGWVFRERKLCAGWGCVTVLEWHGPEATEHDIEWMRVVASSIRITIRLGSPG